MHKRDPKSATFHNYGEGTRSKILNQDTTKDMPSSNPNLKVPGETKTDIPDPRRDRTDPANNEKRFEKKVVYRPPRVPMMVMTLK